MVKVRGLMGVGLVLAVAAGPVAAQPAAPTAQKPVARVAREPGRGFVAINAGVQAGPSSVTDEFTFTANAEAGRIEATYPAMTPWLLDASVGYRFWGRFGIAVGGSRVSSTETAFVRASVPHPLLIDHDREVEGESPDATRTESAAHLQLFYEMVPKGKWRGRFFGGPSYFTTQQDRVRDVTVDDIYPFDTATFRSALTGQADGSGFGINAGVDLSWMFSRRAGAGLLVRYARAGIDLNAPDSRRVSTDGGGLQAGAGLRLLF